MGKYLSSDDIKSDCDPVYLNKHIKVPLRNMYNNETLKEDDPAFPCGLIAKSFFNDTYSIKLKGDNNTIDEFTAKQEFTDIVNMTLIKESQDYTEAFLQSRKLFNTKFNQVKRDNMLKKNEINNLETKKFSLIDDNGRGNNTKNVNLF